jgi:RHS repeat-associated protein
VQFTLPPSIVNALSTQNYGDLVASVELDFPPNPNSSAGFSDPFYIDRLDFGQGSGSPNGGSGGGGSGGSGGVSGRGGAAGAGSGGTAGHGGNGGGLGAGGVAGGGGAHGGAAGTAGAGGGPSAGTAGSGTSGPCAFAAQAAGSSTDVAFAIKLPAGVHREDVGLSTTGGSLTLADGVSVVRDSGGFASISSVQASGPTNLGMTNLGVAVQVQDAYTEPTGIELRSNVHVHGTLKTAGSETTQTGATIDGLNLQQTSLQPLESVSWTVSFPNTSHGSCSLEPDNTEVIDPGSYGDIAVKSRSHLKIRSGTYYFNSLSFEPQSVLEIDNRAGPVFIYMRTTFAFGGTVVEANPTQMNFLFGVAGTSDVNIQSAFRGLLVAPFAAVSLPTDSNVGHVGSFFAKSILANANTVIHLRPLAPGELCASDAACSSFCPCGPTGGTCAGTPSSKDLTVPDPNCMDGACCSAGASVVTLTSGADTRSNAAANTCVVGLAGNDALSSSAPGATLVGGAGDDTITTAQFSSGASSAPVRVFGGSGNDNISGWFDGAQIYGGPGDDKISAGPGSVLIAPGGGVDDVSSGDGDDTFVLYSECEATPGKKLLAGGGFDTLISPLSIDQLRARGLTVEGFENVIIRSDACKSDCTAKPACAVGTQCADRDGHAVCGASTGSSCQTCNDCASGLSCTSGTCQDPCVVNPLAAGCAGAHPGHCADGIRDANETDVDCGGTCAACPTGSGCTVDADCGADSVCGTSNGACFGHARAQRVCWKSSCQLGTDVGGCGSADSACGQNCACVNGCDASSVTNTCAAGEICKAGFGRAFAAPTTPDVCVDVRCPSNDPALCGSPSSVCGASCVCTADCSHATCANPSDGCGGTCPNVCKVGDPGCHDDVNCPSGSSCLADPSGTAICRPSSCAFRILAPPLCGTSGAVCGDTCPTCTPSCENRQCGLDPVCGQSCGSCGDGTNCSADGQCIPPSSKSPPTVPDGKGGQTPLPPLPPSSTVAVGALKGQFSVTDDGTAAYTIPIEVPPGRAGIEPALSFSYTSSHQNQDLGVGWHIDGLSKITRCPRSFALDGSAVAIQNDPSDVFCLDGKRLMAVSGTYGSDLTEYRTLVDSFAKIVSHVDPGPGFQLPFVNTTVPRAMQGPDYFQVFTKDGRILTFGRTFDSLVLAGSGVRYSWLLDRVEDRSGNSMDVHYTNAYANVNLMLAAGQRNVVRPWWISYTGHGGTAGNRQVRFDYESRSDPQISFFQGGVSSFAADRLSRVTTLVDSLPVKNYHLQYGPGELSQVAQISECAGGDDSTCKTPTKFEYRQEHGFAAPMPFDGADFATAGQLDADGDGAPDFLVTKIKVDDVPADEALQAAAITTDIAVGVASQALTPAGALAVNVFWDAVKGSFWGQFGSDPTVTATDQLAFGSTNRSQTVQIVNDISGIRCDVKSNPMFLLDYNQDGRDDILSGCNLRQQDLFLALSGSTRGALTNFPSDGSAVLHRDVPDPRTVGVRMNTFPVIADIDGDGLEDVLQCKDEFTLQLWRRSLPLAGSNFQNMTQGFAAQPIELTYPTPPGSNSPTQFQPVPFCDQYIPTYKMMDVDGDGAPDLLVWDLTGWFVLKFNAPLGGSPSLSFQPVQFIDVGGGTGSAGGRLALADFNGDGLQDIWSYGDRRNVIIWLNNGNKVFTSRQFGHPPGVGFEPQPPSPYQRRATAILDYNGDGKSDLLEHWEYDTVSDGELFEHNVNNGLLPDSVVQMLSGVDIPELTFRFPEGGVVPASFTSVADIDADGNPDLFGGSGEIFYGSGALNTLLDKVTDGLGNVLNVNYDESGTYKADSCVGTWPEKCLKTANGLVSSHTEGVVSSQGNAVTERTYKYHYFNAHLSTTGHGWLGFDQRTIDFQTPVAGGSTTTIDFEPLARFTPQGNRTSSTLPPYLYPLVGLPKTVTVDVYTDSGLSAVKPPLQSDFFDSRVQTINTWAVQESSSRLGFPITSSRDVTSYERPVAGGAFLNPSRPPFEDNGIFVSECFDEYLMDAFGNVTSDKQKCQFQEEWVEFTHTIRSFQSDTASWLITNPVHTEVISDAATEATRTWDMGYTSAGLLHSVTRALNGSADQQHTTLYDRDDFGNVSEITEQVPAEADRITGITYDPDNVFPATITNAAGQTTQLDFDSRWGAPFSIVDPNGIAVQTSYDAFGREGRSDGPTGTTVTTYSTIPTPNTITAIGSIEPRIQVTVEHRGTANTPDGSNITEVDNYGRAVRQISTGFGGVNVIEEQAFDALGRSLGRTLPHTADTAPVPFDRYSYDGLTRLARIDHSDGSHREFQYATSASLDPSHNNWMDGMTCPGGMPIYYCAVGFKLTIDETGRQNAEVTDHRGRTIRNIDGNNVATAAQTSNYSFGAFGQLVQTSDNRNLVTSYLFDDYGRLQSELGPARSRAYTYNGFDQLKTTFDPSRVLRTYQHDSLGRLTSIVDPAGTTQWIFDQNENGLGRLSQSISPATDANPSGQSVSYNYEPVSANNRGLLHSVTYSIDGNSYPVLFDYDDLGRTQNIHYPFSSPDAPIIAQNKYDVSGLLTGVDEIGSGTAKRIWHLDTAYQGHLVQQETFGNGATTTYGYNSARHWLENIQTILGSDQIQSLAYTHYNNGLIDKLTNGVSTSVEYAYDPVNRLSSVTPLSPSPTVTSYGYDDLGNLTNRAGTITTYRSAQPYLIDSVGNNTYNYDLNNNVSGRTGPDIPGGSQTLTYTPFDLPNTVTTGGETVTLDYSADEERVVRRDPNITSHFVPDLYQHKLDESGNTLEERFRLYAGDRPLGEIIRANGTDRTLYFHTDHLGSTTTLSDSNGEVTTQNFDPFGMPLNPTVPAATRVGFTGQEQDGDMGLTDMKGRIYDPLAGRFMSADPIVQAPFWSQGLNRYSYVFNNPINNTDPSGYLSLAAGYQGGAYFTDSWWGVAGSFASVGLTIGLDAYGVGVPGAARPGSTSSVTPSATAKSSAVTPQTVQAKGQNKGGVGPARPSLFDPARGALAQAVPGAEGGPGSDARSDGTGGSKRVAPATAIPLSAPVVEEALAVLGRVLRAVATIGVEGLIELTAPFTMESDAAPYQAQGEKGGRPSNNQVQNKQAKDAVREYERQTGRKLSRDDLTRAHREFGKAPNPGFDELVDILKDTFGE